MLRKVTSCVLLLCFFASTLTVPARAQGVQELPVPGTMVALSPTFEPVLLKGLKVDPKNPFAFDFILDTGNTNLNAEDPALKAESNKLIKYFLAAMTVPEKNLWVNLSPYEKDRMIAQDLGQTEMGRDMLAQDYVLKQLTASLIYPEKELGKTFWDKVYAKSRELYGTTEVPVNTFNKVWIVAERADVFERGNTAYVTGAHLKVMLAEDYTALEKNQSSVIARSPKGDAAISNEIASPQKNVVARNDAANLASQIVREIILPELEKEVNTGKNFAPLRQMFYAMILASWYKTALKDAVLTQIYGDQGKVSAGVNAADEGEKDKIFERYLQAYKKGVFNYIKEDMSAASGQPVPRKYFSGGADFAMLRQTGVLHRSMEYTGSASGRVVQVSGDAAMTGSSQTSVLNPTGIFDAETLMALSSDDAHRDLNHLAATLFASVQTKITGAPDLRLLEKTISLPEGAVYMLYEGLAVPLSEEDRKNLPQEFQGVQLKLDDDDKQKAFVLLVGKKTVLVTVGFALPEQAMPPSRTINYQSLLFAKTVLLTDPDPSVRHQLRKLFEMQGAVVTDAVGDQDEIIQAVSDSDLVVMSAMRRADRADSVRDTFEMAYFYAEQRRHVIIYTGMETDNLKIKLQNERLTRGVRIIHKHSEFPEHIRVIIQAEKFFKDAAMASVQGPRPTAAQIMPALTERQIARAKLTRAQAELIQKALDEGEFGPDKMTKEALKGAGLELENVKYEFFSDERAVNTEIDNHRYIKSIQQGGGLEPDLAHSRVSTNSRLHVITFTDTDQSFAILFDDHAMLTTSPERIALREAFARLESIVEELDERKIANEDAFWSDAYEWAQTQYRRSVFINSAAVLKEGAAALNMVSDLLAQAAAGQQFIDDWSTDAIVMRYEEELLARDDAKTRDIAERIKRFKEGDTYKNGSTRELEEYVRNLVFNGPGRKAYLNTLREIYATVDLLNVLSQYGISKENYGVVLGQIMEFSRRDNFISISHRLKTRHTQAKSATERQVTLQSMTKHLGGFLEEHPHKDAIAASVSALLTWGDLEILYVMRVIEIARDNHLTELVQLMQRPDATSMTTATQRFRLVGLEHGPDTKTGAELSVGALSATDAIKTRKAAMIEDIVELGKEFMEQWRMIQAVYEEKPGFGGLNHQIASATNIFKHYEIMQGNPDYRPHPYEDIEASILALKQFLDSYSDHDRNAASLNALSKAFFDTHHKGPLPKVGEQLYNPYLVAIFIRRGEFTPLFAQRIMALKAAWEKRSKSGTIAEIVKDLNDLEAAQVVPGGIDLDRAKMQMKVEKEGEGVSMQFDQAMIERIKREGFDGLEFNIRTIVPIADLRQFLFT